MEQFFMVQETRQKPSQLVSSPVMLELGFQSGVAGLQIKPNVAFIHLAGKSTSRYLAVAFTTGESRRLDVGDKLLEIYNFHSQMIFNE